MILAVSTMEVYGKSYNTSGCTGTIWDAVAESTKGKANQSRRAGGSAVYASDIYRHDRAGERNPTIRTLYKIAKALKVKASDLLPF